MSNPDDNDTIPDPESWVVDAPLGMPIEEYRQYVTNPATLADLSIPTQESSMDHTTYLERHHELVNTGLSTLAQMHAREDYEGAAAYLTELRAQADALWEQRRAIAAQTVNK